MASRGHRTAVVLLLSLLLSLSPAVGVLEASPAPALPNSLVGHRDVEPVSEPPSLLPAGDAAGDRLQGPKGRTDGLDVAEVHARGVTGAGVKVGVIDADFDPGAPAIEDRVAGVHSVAGPRTPSTHGTAVAEVVSDTSPGSQLYLAAVGRDPTPTEYATAIRWLIARDVDVIVDAGSYFPPTGVQAESMTITADRASERGVVFVTSAGNYARRHWEGAVGDEEWVSFAPGVQSNPLANGSAFRGRVSLRLQWQSAADYDLYLYRHRRNAPDAVVAKSTANRTGEDGAMEAIDVAVPRGRYYVAVHVRSPAAEPGRLELFAARRELRYENASGSVLPPATSERVIVVGASNPGTGDLTPYSSRRASGRPVDLLAPDHVRTDSVGEFSGTSAAAPYVAGTAALLMSRERNLSPAEVERILVRTGPGRGVDPAAAVESVTSANASRPDPDPE